MTGTALNDGKPFVATRQEPTSMGGIPGQPAPEILAARAGGEKAESPPPPDADLLPKRGEFSQRNINGLCASFAYQAREAGEGSDVFEFSYNWDGQKFRVFVDIQTLKYGEHETVPHRNSPGRACVGTPPPPLPITHNFVGTGANMQ